MSKRTFVFGLITNILVGLCCYLTNLFVEHTNDPEARLYGGLSLSFLSVVLIILFITRWATLNTASFFVVNMMMFLRCSFDLVFVIEKLQEPYNQGSMILSSYLRIDEPLVNNVWCTLMSLVAGTLLHVINYMIFYRVNMGLHTRNLLLFNSASLFTIFSLFFIITLTSGLPYHPFTVIVLVTSAIFIVLPLLVLKSNRDFELTKTDDLGCLSTNLNFFSVPLMIITAIIFICKLLVTQLETAWPLTLISDSDPMLAFSEIPNTYPYAVALCWLNAGLLVPTLIVSSLFHFVSSKPSFLWELSLMRASMIITGQVYFLGGPFFWETPEVFHVSPANVFFWVVNLVPIVAGIVEILSLYQYKKPLLPPCPASMNRRHSYGKL